MSPLRETKCSIMILENNKQENVIVSFCFFLRLLIGSPRARALKNQKSNITGGLFKCDVSKSKNCERVEFDNDGESFHLPANLASYLPV